MIYIIYWLLPQVYKIVNIDVTKRVRNNTGCF